MVKIQIQLRHSIFIIIICHDVEGHEKRGEYIRQQIQCISSYLIGKLVAVLQFMQVINKQQNGIKHEYMLHFCNCMQATYLLFFYQKLLDWFTFSPQNKSFCIYCSGQFFYKHLMKLFCFINGNRFSKTISYYLILEHTLFSKYSLLELILFFFHKKCLQHNVFVMF